MQNIKDLFQKIQKILNQKDLEKEIIQNSLEKIIGIKVDFVKIEIKDNIVYLKEKPIIKNEILYHKEKILEEINKNNPKILDIK